MVYLPALCDGAGRLESGTGIHVLLSGTEHLCIRKYRRRKDQNRFKEKTIVWIGGGIFAAGILASAFLIVPTPLPMYLSYGVMQGFGQGMIYTVILATVQRWFPDRTGFASGVVVTANGLCGFFLAPLSRKLLEAEGVQKTFLIIGAAICSFLDSVRHLFSGTR